MRKHASVERGSPQWFRTAKCHLLVCALVCSPRSLIRSPRSLVHSPGSLICWLCPGPGPQVASLARSPALIHSLARSLTHFSARGKACDSCMSQIDLILSHSALARGSLDRKSSSAYIFSIDNTAERNAHITPHVMRAFRHSVFSLCRSVRPFFLLYWPIKFRIPDQGTYFFPPLYASYETSELKRRSSFCAVLSVENRTFFPA